MPLENGEWRETTPEDLKAFEASLDSSLQEVQLTAELEARLANAMRPMHTGLEVLVEGNLRLYPQVERLMSAGAVDIVVPVHNAWHVTRKCLDAVRGRTSWPHNLIVVDDASDATTQSKLIELERSPLPMTRLRNAKNRGFAATVNRGIKAGSAPFVCLLNSDVIVTPGWLTKMVMALHADERNAIVCPATNNTAVVDVPMSPGASYLHMAQAFEGFAARRYPEILPTGFCFLFRRSLLEQIGYFDEGFRDFGEETAWWWKVVQAGGRAVMADDTYVFHERASSYSALGAEKHSSYRRAASARFNQLYPEWTLWRDAYDVKTALGPLRVPVPPTLLRSPKDLWRVCWVVHDARACGAMRYIADLANELNERGVNAKVVVLKREGTPEEWLGELRSAPVYFASQEELLEDFAQRVFPSGLVIAATVELAPAVRALVDASGGTLRGCLHAQSFEPALAKAPEEIAHLQALYTLLPDVITGSRWVGEEIAALGVTPFACVHPGVDRTLFYPRDRAAGDERPTVAIPMNPSVWWRGWERGLELIAELERQADARGIELRILVYGVESLPITSRAICLGTVTQARLAHVLGTEVDALVDPSHVHSYGMPCLEAAACTVQVFSWDNRGIDETVGIPHPSTESPAEMAAYVLEHLGKFICIEAVLERHDRAKNVSAWIDAVESHFRLGRRHHRICIVAPHLRKWGGPTTMLAIAHELARRGHSVEVATVYEDVHPAIANWAQVPIRKGELPDADLYIVNSDNPWVERISALPVKRILLKLSHNPRFKREEEKGLQQAWDAIVTSTEWLAVASAAPMEGWNHPAKPAHVIGWWHYEHARFRCPPSERTYGDGSAERPFVIGTLIHAHPTKGTTIALSAFEGLLALHGGRHYRFIGIGEVPPRAAPKGIQYVYEPTRDQLAEALKQCDIWLSTSQSEGLGRMTLEAMSAGCVVVARDTGAEHLEAAFRYTPKGLERDAALWALGHVCGDAELMAELRTRGFETAEAAANPEACINALEEVISGIA